MKILWLTVDRSHRIASQFDIFRSNVEKIADVTTVIKPIKNDLGQNMWQSSRDIISGKLILPNIVDKYLEGSDYDFIFCDAFFAYMDEDWKSFGIQSGILIEDVHQEVPKIQIECARSLNIETIFHRFNFAFHKFHPEAKSNFNCLWLPHSADTNLIKPSNDKQLQVLHVGVCPERYYPYRSSVVKQLSNKNYFTKIDRPKEGLDRDNKWPIDSDYYNLLASAYITITGGSIYNAPVQKYVEIPAANSMLMSNWFDDLGLMGFVPAVNMLTYTVYNIVEKIEKILPDKDLISQISNAGYKLITSLHTSSIRSKQFINMICDILNKQHEFPNIKTCSNNINFNYSKPITKRLSPREQVAIRTDWRSRIK